MFRTSSSLHLDHWPERTTESEGDIFVAGLSLLRLADVSGTPAVLTAASVVPDSGGQSSDVRRSAVLVVRVVATAAHQTLGMIAQLDARLDNLRLVWPEARLIGRRSSARQRRWMLVRKPSEEDMSTTRDVLPVDLPADLEMGDLLAIPSRSIRNDSPARLHPLTGRLDSMPDLLFAASPAPRSPWWESLD
jgi:hypothetical protein